MKSIQYRGYIYWLLMILGAFFGNMVDGVHSDLFFPILLIIIFAILGDFISQIIIWSKLYSVSKLSVIKYYRIVLLFFSIIWMNALCLPTFIDCLLNRIYFIPVIEFLLLVLLFLNKIKWMAYQVKVWSAKHTAES